MKNLIKILFLCVIIAFMAFSCEEEDGKEYIRVSGIVKTGETVYGYGTHALFDHDTLRYMLISDNVDLNDYLNDYITIKGEKVQGYPLNENEPELLKVISIINDN